MIQNAPNLKQIKVSHSCPEIYQRIRETFKDVEWEKGLIITYFPLIHCVKRLSLAKIVHESVHLRRQEEDGVESWWDRYFDDIQFRLEEEVLAYATEADFVKEMVKNRNLRFRMIHDMAVALSGSMYGKIISYSDALNFINKK